MRYLSIDQYRRQWSPAPTRAQVMAEIETGELPAVYRFGRWYIDTDPPPGGRRGNLAKELEQWQQQDAG